MSKKGENIYKRKDGRWEGRYIRCYDTDGKAKYGYIYGRTYSDVKDELVQKRQMQFASQIPEVCELLYIAISWMVGSEHQS